MGYGKIVSLPGGGQKKEVRLGQGEIRYRDEGTGQTLVFVHGIIANGVLWRDVVPRLSGDFRCVVPDLPLGGHSLPMREDADLTPRGVASLLACFLEALDLRDVTLVGNDTGGAICQIVVAEHPERVGRLVLTNCDSYEAFFPWLISPLHHGARLFGERFVDGLAWTLRTRTAQRLLLWPVSKRRAERATLDAYVGPLLRDAGVRRDLARFLGAVSKRHTLEAAKSFPGFHRPVLIAWGEDDFVFSAATPGGSSATSLTPGWSSCPARARSSLRTNPGASRSLSWPSPGPGPASMLPEGRTEPPPGAVPSAPEQIGSAPFAGPPRRRAAGWRPVELADASRIAESVPFPRHPTVVGRREVTKGVPRGKKKMDDLPDATAGQTSTAWETGPPPPSEDGSVRQGEGRREPSR